MQECCKNKTTAYCPDCGSNLESHSWPGLKEDLERRLANAKETLKLWREKPGPDKKKAAAGIARNSHNVERLENWIKLVARQIQPVAARPASSVGSVPPLRK